MAHWQDRLAYSCSVGGTHWEGLGSGKGLAGPRPVLFFAPAQGKKRMTDWGPKGFQDRLAGAWTAFLARARDPSRPWLQVVAGTAAGRRSNRPIRRCSTARFPPTKAGSWRFEISVRPPPLNLATVRPILPQSTA